MEKPSYIERFVDRAVLPHEIHRVGAYIKGCNGRNCQMLKALASQPCKVCGKPLGFLRLFHDYGTHVVHRLCDTRYTITHKESP